MTVGLFEDKVAVVTGAARGQGAEHALLLAEGGRGRLRAGCPG